MVRAHRKRRCFKVRIDTDNLRDEIVHSPRALQAGPSPPHTNPSPDASVPSP